MNYRNCVVRLGTALVTAAIFGTSVYGQEGLRRFQCSGYVNGVASEALLEVAPGGLYLGIGAIAGQATGDTLNFEWSWANNYGRGVFKASRDGSAFSGTWGYRESADNAGTWNGQRAD